MNLYQIKDQVTLFALLVLAECESSAIQYYRDFYNGKNDDHPFSVKLFTKHIPNKNAPSGVVMELYPRNIPYPLETD